MGKIIKAGTPADIRAQRKLDFAHGYHNGADSVGCSVEIPATAKQVYLDGYMLGRQDFLAGKYRLGPNSSMGAQWRSYCRK